MFYFLKPYESWTLFSVWLFDWYQLQCPSNNHYYNHHDVLMLIVHLASASMFLFQLTLWLSEKHTLLLELHPQRLTHSQSKYGEKKNQQFAEGKWGHKTWIAKAKRVGSIAGARRSKETKNQWYCHWNKSHLQTQSEMQPESSSKPGTDDNVLKGLIFTPQNRLPHSVSYINIDLHTWADQQTQKAQCTLCLLGYFWQHP